MKKRDLSGLRVLVVDDDPNLREMLATTLRSLRAEVRVVGNGSDGLAVLRLWPPSVLLCEPHMQGMNGCSLVKEVRANPDWTRIPVIALTSRGSPGRLVDSTEAGFDAHLIKPVGTQSLYSQIRRCVRGTLQA